jgi:uncharacterized protein
MKIFTGILLFSSFSVMAAMDVPNIQVQGKCELKVIPDQGRVSFTAENQSKDQKTAVDKTHKQINQLKESIKKLNLKDIEFKNTQYSVFPVREYEKDKYVNKGYRAALTLEITTSEIQKLGEAMMEASKAGITNVGSLQTYLSLKKSQEEYLKCLDIAAEDARRKAKQLATKLGFKIGDVIHVNEVPAPTFGPYPERTMMKAMGDSMDAAPTQIEAGTQQYTTNIQVTFSIK